jgi:hypothetical protein
MDGQDSKLKRPNSKSMRPLRKTTDNPPEKKVLLSFLL